MEMFTHFVDSNTWYNYYVVLRLWQYAHLFVDFIKIQTVFCFYIIDR